MESLCLNTTKSVSHTCFSTVHVACPDQSKCLGLRTQPFSSMGKRTEGCHGPSLCIGVIAVLELHSLECNSTAPLVSRELGNVGFTTFLSKEKTGSIGWKATRWLPGHRVEKECLQIEMSCPPIRGRTGCQLARTGLMNCKCVWLSVFLME